MGGGAVGLGNRVILDGGYLWDFELGFLKVVLYFDCSSWGTRLRYVRGNVMARIAES